MKTDELALPIAPRLGSGFVVVMAMMVGVAAIASVWPRHGLLAALALHAAMAAVLLAWVCAHSVTRPVRALVDQAWRLAGGDLAVSVVRDRRDELGDLQQALACLQDQLRHIEQLRRSVLHLNDGRDLRADGPDLFRSANADRLEPARADALRSPSIPPARDDAGPTFNTTRRST